MNQNTNIGKIQTIEQSDFQRNNKFLYGLTFMGFGVHASRSLMSCSALSVIQGNLLGPLGFSIMYTINFIPAILFIWLNTNYFSLNACIIGTIIGQICLSVAIINGLSIFVIIGETIFGFAAFLIIINQRTLISVYNSLPAFGLSLSVSIASFVKLASKIGISGITLATTNHRNNNSSYNNSNYNEDDDNFSAFIISLFCIISCIVPLIIANAEECNTSISVVNNVDIKHLKNILNVVKTPLSDNHKLTTYNTMKQNINNNQCENDRHFIKFNLSQYRSILMLPITLHAVNIFLYHPIDTFIPHILARKFDVTKSTMIIIQITAPLIDMLFAPVVGYFQDHYNFDAIHLIIINLIFFSIAVIFMIYIDDEMDNISHNNHQESSVNFISLIVAYTTIALTRTFLTILVLSLVVTSMTALFDKSLTPAIDIESVIIYEESNMIQDKKNSYQKGFISMEIVSNFVNIVAYLAFGTLYSESNGYTKSLSLLVTVSIMTTIVLVSKLWRKAA